MTDKPSKLSFEKLRQDAYGETAMERRIRHFADFVERNKTRRRRDGDPPAALPVPMEPRRGGPFLKGGAAAALVFENA